MKTSNPSLSSTKKPSSVQHTRAIQRDRSKRPVVAAPDPVVAERLTELIHPQTVLQVARYHDLDLRERVLTLPVMVALVLSMIWRQIGSVATLLHLRVFPATLCRDVLLAFLPTLQAREQERQRPLPPELAWARAHYPAVLACDGSTLDALLRDCPAPP